jgi:hypothetical protein
MLCGPREDVSTIPDLTLSMKQEAVVARQLLRIGVYMACRRSIGSAVRPYR